jgi:hypothetical protein
MRRRSALLALLAVLLHALAPLLANAAPGGAAVDHVQLCTAQGIVTVEVESGGAPAGKPAAPDHCSVCAFQTVIAVTPCAGQLLQTGARTLIPLAEQALPRFSSPYTARPRAPPHRS